MFVHEYQAKNLLANFDLPFPEGSVAHSAQQAQSAAQSISAEFWVIKAQILAGDRGRFGGVKMAHSPADAGNLTKTLLGTTLVTPQTGSDGLPVEAVYVEQGCEIQSELFLAVVLDRYEKQLVLLASRSGGSGIESALADSSQSIERIPLSVDTPACPDRLAELAASMHLSGAAADNYVQICQSIHRAVGQLDALSIELNPLALTGDGKLLCLDVKMELDDNALFRHSEYADIQDANLQVDRRFRAQSGYNYVRLNGDVGLLVGGAGLALATMDLMLLHGVEPANFLDLPPIASRSDVADACNTVLEDKSVNALLVNVVGGGLTHCDTVAEGLITVHRSSGIKCPIIVRFAGTKKEHGITLLKNSKIRFQLARTMSEAVEMLLAIK